jgi:hypothetical protein
LLVDTEGKCHAVGTILDGVAEIGRGDAGRGARYNSAVKYVDTQAMQKRRCLAVVVSEDGMVDVVPPQNACAQE